MSESNCLIFALKMWKRRKGKADRQGIFMRKSDSGWFPHFVYQETRRGRVRQMSYRPVAPVQRFLPPPLFVGTICWGDERRGKKRTGEEEGEGQ